MIKFKIGDKVMWKRNGLKGIVNGFGYNGSIEINFGEFGEYSFWKSGKGRENLSELKRGWKK